MQSILIVEDNENLIELYKQVLSKAGFFVFSAHDGEEALNLMKHTHLDLMVTDVMMPKMDGYELAEFLRELENEIPILMITAKGSLEDKKIGFRIGIDDYMVKPIDVQEMVLRVEALLRRSKMNKDHKLTVGNTILNQDQLTVTSGSEMIELPNKEFQLLYKLLSNLEKIFTRRQLMNDIWGFESDTYERTVDVHIKRLRSRFSRNTDFGIITIRGLGYKAVLKNEK
ncbi:response regulator transcription factor [Marinilactibacillus psychrotolerans]|uniref:Heme response regulator HssR n=1 Tax=Marinilactibacillus psychrotolerans TaxID=191770 RepID=A0AAV3WVY4_9LACT|nr:response regulator transcription factor [Marinilactibacillus psychrotolerans]GEL66739.1 DNA-binding response regulator [Marinilactibacillus psychrotolerans]GEQ35814.1 two-component system response regulator [Marinilactibacillus psychrotolerans]SDC32251.1 DNA-binding response regulator, OmpR family, contains REC and winged-helix (wHTH) domain [Marinilactibacillus psychrotolerans]